jgi:transcriptional regulator with XRE-family HTH domain
MAEIMGMSQPTLARIESGHRKETKGQIAHLETIVALSEILGHYYDKDDGVSLIPYMGPSDAQIKTAWERARTRTV